MDYGVRVTLTGREENVSTSNSPILASAPCGEHSASGPGEQKEAGVFPLLYKTPSLPSQEWLGALSPQNPRAKTVQDHLGSPDHWLSTSSEVGFNMDFMLETSAQD